MSSSSTFGCSPDAPLLRGFHHGSPRSHFRQAFPRRRRHLQGAGRRGRRQARPRQGRARQDHRRLRRPRDPLGDQGHRQAARACDQAEGRRPRRHRRRQRRHPRRHRARRHRDEHAVRQLDHDRRARHRAHVRARPAASGRRRLHPGRQVGEEPLHGRRAHRQDARRDRLRQHRLDRRRRAASGSRCGSSPTIRSSAPSAPPRSASRRSSSTICSRAPTSSPCTRR